MFYRLSSQEVSDDGLCVPKHVAECGIILKCCVGRHQDKILSVVLRLKMTGKECPGLIPCQCVLD